MYRGTLGIQSWKGIHKINPNSSEYENNYEEKDFFFNFSMSIRPWFQILSGFMSVQYLLHFFLYQLLNSYCGAGLCLCFQHTLMNERKQYSKKAAVKVCILVIKVACPRN